MPNVGGRFYPYTAKGKKAAEAAKEKLKNKKPKKRKKRQGSTKTRSY